MANDASKTNSWTSWIPIPSGVQKKVLWYAISHFGIIDTNALDLEQLDITFGKRSEIILRDVGLQINVGLMNEEKRLGHHTDSM